MMDDCTPSRSTVLSLTDVSKTYDGTKTVLRNVTLQVKETDFWRIGGASGSGKSTLLAVASTLTAPTSGNIAISGEDVTKLCDKKLSLLRRQHCGFVFQKAHLISDLTAVQNTLVNTDWSTASLQRSKELLQRFGLEEVLERKAKHLSGGEAQRVAVARALMNEPKIIFADEPTASLDDAAASGVLQLLQQHAASGGAVILVSHDRRTVSHANVQGRLDNGTLQEIDPGEY